jgi:hypothetical protein
VLCFFVLSALRRETTGDDLEVLLIQELTRPQLLLDATPPPAPRLPNSAQLPTLPHDTNA